MPKYNVTLHWSEIYHVQVEAKDRFEAEDIAQDMAADGNGYIDEDWTVIDAEEIKTEE